MKSFGGLWERVVAFGNLAVSAKKAAKGTQRTIEVQSFLYNLETELLQLKHELDTGTYCPGNYRTFTVHDPKRRLISAAPFRDRVVHHAVCDVMEPTLKRIYVGSSYACRKGKGTHKAVELAQRYIRKNRYFLKCDIRQFFNSVSHEVLKLVIRRRYEEESLLSLLFRIIDNPVPGCLRDSGLAIGNLTSQHFANLLLTEFDLFVLHKLKPAGYVRYMDDFVLFDNSKERLQGFRYEISEYLAQEMKLSLKQGITFVAPVTHGLPFLGFQIFPSTKRIDGKVLRRASSKLKLRTSQWRNEIISDGKYDRSLNSIFGHLKSADTLKLRKRIVQANLVEEVMG